MDSLMDFMASMNQSKESMDSKDAMGSIESHIQLLQWSEEVGERDQDK